MNKKFTLFLILLIIGISYFFDIEKLVQNKFSVLNSNIQSTQMSFFATINNAFSKYLNQLSYIDQLKISNEENQHYKTLYNTTSNQLTQLNKNLKLIKENQLNIDLEKVNVLSYYKFNDNSRVILDKKGLVNSKIYALITFDGFSAGIVLNQNDISVAYLNENKKANYTVFIGEDNIPGITSGINQKGQLIVKYVPIWKNISIGDEVITSSMDNVFPFGIKVGRVTKIDEQDNMKEISVRPYAQTLGNRDYYLYESPNTVK